MRFKNSRAYEFIALMSFTMSLVAVSIDGVLPALPVIALELGFITLQHSQMVVSLFVLGMVFGELLFGPLCDANGRRPALVLGGELVCEVHLAAPHGEIRSKACFVSYVLRIAHRRICVKVVKCDLYSNHHKV